jgi:glucose-6-phosphate-specific signal transduction histidine kinase
LHPARVRLQAAKVQNLPKKIESIAYRLIQECCNNIAKHSEARHVNISLASADGVLRLQVEDDGVGFEVEEAFQRKDSFGLAGMRERVALLGGKFHVESCPSDRFKPEAVRGVEGSGSRRRFNRGDEALRGSLSKGRKKRGTTIRIELPISNDPDSVKSAFAGALPKTGTFGGAQPGAPGTRANARTIRGSPSPAEPIRKERPK